MRRRTEIADSSLELLLDTITNTFGGILFLAILIAVILQFSEVPTAPGEDSNLTEFETAELLRDVELAKEQLQVLARAREIQSTFSEHLKRTVSPDSIEQIRSVREEHRALTAQLTEKQKAIAETSLRITDLAKSVHDLDENLAATALAQAKLAKVLQAEIEEHSTDFRLPRSRGTSKNEFALALRYDRVYRPYIDDGPFKQKANVDDFVVVSNDASEIRMTPKPYRGLSVQNEEEFRDGLRRLLATKSPRDDYIALAVWYDSFDIFQIVKSELVSLGFQYRLVPVGYGGSVSTGYVVDPHVQ